MRAIVDHEALFAIQHCGWLKLIECLTAAHRTGELPNYMLDFIASLRTPANPAMC